jgi:uncharacterized protein (TIGR02145 family)
MKKTFIKFLPFAAAVLLVTSCGKDDNSDNNVVNPNNGTEVVTPENGVETVPFTVKVGTNGKISKIAYSGADGTGNVTPTFEESEVDHLTMIVTGDGVNTTLTLKDVDGTFSGEIVAGLAVDFDLTATITIDGDATSSTTGLENLMKNCGHVYSQSFKYGDVTSGNKIMLVDNKSYIEVSWTNKGGQNVTISEQTYTLNSDGKIWIAIEAGSNIVSDDLDVSSTTTVAGDIYTISRTFGAVTGIEISGGFTSSESSPYVWGSENSSEKTLTATVSPENAINKNVSWTSSDPTIVSVDENGVITIIAPNTETSAKKVTITATAQDGSNVTATYDLWLDNYVDLGISGIQFATTNSANEQQWTKISDKNTIPTQDEWKALVEQCYWVRTDNGIYVFKAQSGFFNQNGYPAFVFNDVYKKDGGVPYIFLPNVPGRKEGTYWSSTEKGNDTYTLSVFSNSVSYTSSCYRGAYLSVRTVRRSN